MMNYISIASPGPRRGSKPVGKKLTVPNQALSLAEILRRFTRGEPLEVGMGTGVYHESDTDLEKVGHMDLVDRQEYVEKLKQVQKDYEKQERKKLADRKREIDKLAYDEAVKAASDKLAQASPVSPSKPGTGVS